jgi:hypothetical protein
VTGVNESFTNVDQSTAHFITGHAKDFSGNKQVVNKKFVFIDGIR